MDRTELVELVLADLDAILARTRRAYLERLPRVRTLDPAQLEDVIEATRRAMQSFLRYYVEGTLDGPSWQAVREATIERAGELFTSDEILEIISIGRTIATDALHHMTDAHPELGFDELNQVGAALDRYISELALQEDRFRQLGGGPDQLDSVLVALEEEGADLA